MAEISVQGRCQTCNGSGTVGTLSQQDALRIGRPDLQGKSIVCKSCGGSGKVIEKVEF